MDATPGGAAGSGNSGGYCSEIAETLRFEEEIQSLMRPDNAAAASSFIALLGLPPTQALELLDSPPDAVPLYYRQQQQLLQQGRMLKQQHQLQPQLDARFQCSPTFPSNAGLVERAARFSVFAAAEESPETSAVVPSNSGSRSPRVKPEPADSDSSLLADKPPPPPPPTQPRHGKRKEPEKSKAASKSSGKKGRSGGEGPAAEDGGGDEKLPYVHVRARRGQATDSHSLAERARREKINARMKLLQELVPGCSKISGTALVLDEIINHVQALQRQVEFLSMRLAAVNPRIDFSGLDNFLAGENGRLTGAIGAAPVGMDASSWPDVHVDGVRRQERQQQQQIWQVDLLPSHQSSSVWDRDDHNQQHHHGFITSGPALFGYDSANPAPMHVNQLKTEL